MSKKQQQKKKILYLNTIWFKATGLLRKNLCSPRSRAETNNELQACICGQSKKLSSASETIPTLISHEALTTNF